MAGKLRYSKINVRPRPDGFGAGVTGVTLSNMQPAETLADLRTALAEHGMLWFPDQPLSHGGFEALARQLGPLGVNPFVQALPDHPDIVEVRRDPDERAVVFGGGWHSDWSFLAEPPLATLLHAKVVPPSGGDTLFCDTRRAFEELSKPFRTMLANLRASHTAGGPYGSEGYFAKESGRSGMQIVTGPEADALQVHPVAPIHPSSLRRALFVSPGYTVAIEGWSRAESDALLQFLAAHMTNERFVYRHIWQPDMLVIWDNRLVLHCATGGYDGHLRMMHRIVLAGGRPS